MLHLWRARRNRNYEHVDAKFIFHSLCLAQESWIVNMTNAPVSLICSSLLHRTKPEPCIPLAVWCDRCVPAPRRCPFGSFSKTKIFAKKQTRFGLDCSKVPTALRVRFLRAACPACWLLDVSRLIASRMVFRAQGESPAPPS